jgi:hypothetical protein
LGLTQTISRGRSDARKTKIPSTKHQIPDKFQVPSSNDPNQGNPAIESKKEKGKR